MPKSIYQNEFVYIILLSIYLVTLVLLAEMGLPVLVFRALLGLVFVLFFPGYCLQVAAFPARADLDGKERLALSFGLSLVLLPILALVLDRLPWGITLWSVMIGLLALVLLFTVIAGIRKSRLPEAEQYRPLESFNPFASWRSLERGFKVAYLLLALTVVSFGFTAYSILTTPKPAERMTEFWMLGSGGKAESYPFRLEAGRPAEITLGIRNLEEGPHSYRIEAVDGQGPVGSAGPFDLPVGESLETQMTLTPQETGEDVQLTFHLFRDSDPTPYRTLRLWVTVQPSLGE